MNSTAENEEILRSVLDRWKAAVDAHEPRQAASYFTQDAIFQGLHPYSVGRQGIADYYERAGVIRPQNTRLRLKHLFIQLTSRLKITLHRARGWHR